MDGQGKTKATKTGGLYGAGRLFFIEQDMGQRCFDHARWIQTLQVYCVFHGGGAYPYQPKYPFEIEPDVLYDVLYDVLAMNRSGAFTRQ